MAKLWQFWEGHPKPAFSKKSAKERLREVFRKSPKKVALPSKTLKHSGSNNIILYLVYTWSAKTAKDFGAKSGSTRARMATLWQFRQGHPKPAFSEKVQREDQGKFFKNRPESSPCLNGLRALWRKWQYPPITMHLKCKTGEDFNGNSGSKQCPNGQVIEICARSPKTRIFWKSANGGPGEIFQKSPRK